jgi:hypothetical protein
MSSAPLYVASGFDSHRASDELYQQLTWMGTWRRVRSHGVLDTQDRSYPPLSA